MPIKGRGHESKSPVYILYQDIDYTLLLNFRKVLAHNSTSSRSNSLGNKSMPIGFLSGDCEEYTTAFDLAGVEAEKVCGNISISVNSHCGYPLKDG
jgi:hypothetical protein